MAESKSNVDFERVQDEIMNKFLDLELRVLTILRFEFDYQFATPFVFNDFFLHEHHNFLKEGFISEQNLADFDSVFYQFFAQTVQNFTLKIVY